MIIVESSVLLAIALEADAHHARATKMAATWDQPVHIPYSVVLEVSRVLWNVTKDSERVADYLDAVLDRFSILVPTPDMILETATYYRQHLARLSFTDCELVVWKKTTGARVETFDTHLEKHLA